MTFHSNCGEKIVLSDQQTLAGCPSNTPGNSLVFTSIPISHEFRIFFSILKKNNGDSTTSLKIGVTDLKLDGLAVLPKCIEDLHKFTDSWWYKGNKVASNENVQGTTYTTDLNTINLGDRIGIQRTITGDLHYFLNHQNLGVAARNVPPTVCAVLDLCGQVELVDIKLFENDSFILIPKAIGRLDSEQQNVNLQSKIYVNTNLPSSSDTMHGAIPKDKNSKSSDDRLRFHKRTGSLVKLSANRRSAQRRHPLDEFNNGVVMTHRCLHDNEMFEIRIDRLVGKWSGSIEMGVTTHNPNEMDFPATMTNMRSGTIMMSGCGILTNGRGTRREYGFYNLDQLQVGDRVGLVRMNNGNLHYFINGNDQGAAAIRVHQEVWGVVDLYGMTVKVTIVGPDDQVENPIEDEDPKKEIKKILPLSCRRQRMPEVAPIITPFSADILSFDPSCNSSAIMITNGQTAYKPFSENDCHNGVVLTNRPLLPDEIFEVCVWSGSVIIGVTIHPPYDLEFPMSIGDFTSGTWVMSSIGVLHNHQAVDKNNPSKFIQKIKVGDRVGLMYQSTGVLRFFLNGVDQGLAVSGIPEKIYGMIDMYGHGAHVSLVQNFTSPISMNSSFSNTTLHGGGELAFHHNCGNNVKLSRHYSVAHKVCSGECSDGIIFSCRPLRECEMFQCKIDSKLQNTFLSGLLSFGVIADPYLDPTIMSDSIKDIYYLDGDVIYSNCKRNTASYTLNLDLVPVNSLIGIMRHADRSVHYYLDGVDMGKAWTIYNLNLFAFIELNGSCTQVSIVPPNPRAFGNSENSQMIFTTGSSQGTKQHTFSEYCGSNIEISPDSTLAYVKKISPFYNLVFASSLLKPDEIFQVEILLIRKKIFGSLRIGVTDFNILNAHVNQRLPKTMAHLPYSKTCYLDGYWIYNNDSACVASSDFNLNKLRVRDTIGIRRIGHTGNISLVVNSEDKGVLFRNVPHKVFVVFELCKSIVSIRTSSVKSPIEDREDFIDHTHSLHLIESLDGQQAGPSGVNLNEQEPLKEPVLKYYHGSNITIDIDAKIVKRNRSYNKGLLIVDLPLKRGQSFKFSVLKINPHWKGSLKVGVGLHWFPPTQPLTSINLHHDYWIVSENHMYLDGFAVCSDYGSRLKTINVGSVVGIVFTECGKIYMTINGINYDPIVQIDGKHKVLYPVIDIYGFCEQISVPIRDSGIPRIEDPFHSSVRPWTDSTESSEHAANYDSTQQEKADSEYQEKEFNSSDQSEESELTKSIQCSQNTLSSILSLIKPGEQPYILILNNNSHKNYEHLPSVLKNDHDLCNLINITGKFPYRSSTVLLKKNVDKQKMMKLNSCDKLRIIILIRSLCNVKNMI